ncbi:MAG: glutaredoxin domain-containing protein [Acholeplasmataceae bacterium]|jgi:glutaredoxin
MPDKLVIYTTSTCPHCAELKKQLGSLGIDFDTRNLEDADVLTDLRVEGCFAMQAPILQIGDMYFQVTE